MYALWLMPDAPTHTRLGQLIEQLSSLHHTPRFEPHVTLLSGIENNLPQALDLLAQMGEMLTVIRASLIRIEHLEYYYRCLFFRTDDSEELFHARQVAESLFAHTKIQPFIPHISFLYGALPILAKEHIIQQLGDRFFTNFYLDRLRLVRVERGPEDWEVLGEVQLY